MSSERVPETLRQQVFERAKGCCEYCRHQAAYSEHVRFFVDHIVPESAGGSTSLPNLALSCFGCNAHKAARTHARDPQTGRRVRLFHPRQQRWRQHFQWNEDFTLTIGRTATGRATVEAMQLNRQGLRNLRRLLRNAGKHPPPDD